MKIVGGVLVVLLFCVAGELMAQRSNVGIKGGLNVSELSSEIVNVAQNYHAGLYVKYDVSKKWTLQTEGLYSLRSAEYDQSTITIREMQFPVLAKYHIAKPIYIQGGFQAEVPLDKAYNEDVSKSLQKHMTSSCMVGAGFSLPSGFDLSFRYLQPIQSSQFSDRQFQISVGFDIY
ncbi:porin family protein [Reichenbachiella sp. 5M10]|uniref:porin family protein n=1 Tax=Reichenbachiella sp. 5M10 TaxID=1889772 RepID=UPI001304704E|nr:porin family protein [Reichenbachiella sp. 5M10]